MLAVDGKGPTLLLLHGFSDSADSFRPLLAELARRGRRAVAVDLPGAGRAGALGRPPLDALDTFAADFVDQHAADGEVILVGNSLGGLVALRAAVQGDLPLTAVVGIGPAGLAYHQRLRAVTGSVAFFGPLLGVLDRVPVPAALVRWAARTFYDRRLAMGRADVELGAFYSSHLGSMRRLGALRRDLIALAAADSVLDARALGNIDVPVLLIWGDQDRLADVAGAPVLLGAVPDSRLVVLEGLGHCPQVEAPAVVADLVAGLPETARSNGSGATPPDSPRRQP
jgi:pimeloyl-ACP methyl ester carboxylesterase